MKQILRLIDRQVAFELKLRYLMPIFVGLGILLNSQIANASAPDLRGFAPVVIHPHQYADYSKDATDLQFAPIDPSIIDALPSNFPKEGEVDGQSPEDPIGITPTALPTFSPTSATGSPQPSATPQASSTPLITLPTLPGPTLSPPLPTLPPVVPTLAPVVPTVGAPIIDLVPTEAPNLPCVPIPFVQSCN